MNQRVNKKWNTSTSTLSAVNIGLTNTNDRHAKARQHFKDESKVVITHMQNVHHTSKLPDMQVQYSSTVDKLSKAMKDHPVYVQKSEQEVPPGATWFQGPESEMKYAEFQDRMNGTIANEADLNERKRRYNKEMGRKASVDEIMTGTAPEGKTYLFPQGATHTQILAQTGALAMPDARVEPPFMPKPRKWLGDDKGWSDDPANMK